VIWGRKKAKEEKGPFWSKAEKKKKTREDQNAMELRRKILIKKPWRGKGGKTKERQSDFQLLSCLWREEKSL